MGGGWLLIAIKRRTLLRCGALLSGLIVSLIESAPL
ncbi:unnamed protein product, partial [Allacma fusca]